MKYWIELQGYGDSGQPVVEKLPVNDYPEMVAASKQMHQLGLSEISYWKYSKKKEKPIKVGTFFAMDVEFVEEPSDEPQTDEEVIANLDPFIL